jgi:hypothetical protein
MPKLPSASAVATSSEVPPTNAISASWIIPAPFMATPLSTPLSMRSIMIGLSPTLIGWAPMPSSTGRFWARASHILRTTSSKSAAPKTEGSRCRNSRSDCPGSQGCPVIANETLLFRSLRRPVRTFSREMGFILGRSFFIEIHAFEKAGSPPVQR